MTVEVFGKFITKDDVMDKVVAHLKIWMPTYLCEVDERKGLEVGKTAWPRSWQVTPKFGNELDKQLPAIKVIVPGTADKPVKEGDGNHRVTWTVGVAALVKGPDEDAASAIAGRYGRAISLVMSQQKEEIDPEVFAVSYEGETFDDLALVTERTLASVVVHFNVTFSNVLNDKLGPVTPPPFEEPITEKDQPGPIIPDEDHIHVTIVPRS